MLTQHHIESNNPILWLTSLLPNHTTPEFSKVVMICQLEDTPMRSLAIMIRDKIYIERELLVITCSIEIEMLQVIVNYIKLLFSVQIHAPLHFIFFFELITQVVIASELRNYRPIRIENPYLTFLPKHLLVKKCGLIIMTSELELYKSDTDAIFLSTGASLQKIHSKNRHGTSITGGIKTPQKREIFLNQMLILNNEIKQIGPFSAKIVSDQTKEYAMSCVKNNSIVNIILRQSDAWMKKNCLTIDCSEFGTLYTFSELSWFTKKNISFLCGENKHTANLTLMKFWFFSDTSSLRKYNKIETRIISKANVWAIYRFSEFNFICLRDRISFWIKSEISIYDISIKNSNKNKSLFCRTMTSRWSMFSGAVIRILVSISHFWVSHTKSTHSFTRSSKNKPRNIIIKFSSDENKTLVKHLSISTSIEMEYAKKLMEVIYCIFFPLPVVEVQFSFRSFVYSHQPTFNQFFPFFKKQLRNIVLLDDSQLMLSRFKNLYLLRNQESRRKTFFHRVRKLSVKKITVKGTFVPRKTFSEIFSQNKTLSQIFLYMISFVVECLNPVTQNDLIFCLMRHARRH
eukprot:gnl/MRDRNA2_/MRDRNA2_86526_c1_seq1.p1 gnl/MRDRNA2_/MRDRNA2_86526_c1~~gnl/MRDRNA2_/MRDRNA2_86526_c1_seq1.p1  ORF type:complete len:661 (-),score=-53.87 gnl/MRDRNA2_/MRDRNA2_86526_c1_seq1:289-2004(-)